jgi:hypothetical protein
MVAPAPASRKFAIVWSSAARAMASAFDVTRENRRRAL